MYYLEGVSQSAIARRLDRSAATVSRLLQEARDEGVVSFSLTVEPTGNIREMAGKLAKTFGLRDALVVPPASGSAATLRSVGVAAGDYLLSLLRPNMTVGVTWGVTLQHLIAELAPVKCKSLQVTQMIGSLGAREHTEDCAGIAFELARKLDAQCRIISAPMLVSSKAVRDRLLNQQQIGATLRAAAAADIMLHGVGSLAQGTSSLERCGYITPLERRQSQKRGAVGHIMAHMIDIEGKEIGRIGERAVSVPLAALRKARRSIGVAANPLKTKPLLGALRAGLFNTLVIDQLTAASLLEAAGG